MNFLIFASAVARAKIMRIHTHGWKLIGLIFIGSKWLNLALNVFVAFFKLYMASKWESLGLFSFCNRLEELPQEPR